MEKFDYIIKGGGCSGLSLAYQLQINGKLKDKRLVIIENREHYSRDKTWSFFKVFPHDFEDCVMQSWTSFSIQTQENSHSFSSKIYPYQSIDSGKFYNKILTLLNKNKNICFKKNVSNIDTSKGLFFNSVYENTEKKDNLWQHFKGIEIETKDHCFNSETPTLMHFWYPQNQYIHFYYVLPFSSTRALIETTWFSPLYNELKNYDDQLAQYIENNFNINKYSILYKEEGAIPLFDLNYVSNKNEIYIGTTGKMTRLSSGYTFLNIQLQSKYIVDHIDNIEKIISFKIPKKYGFFDRVFLDVMKKSPNSMPVIFSRFFGSKTDDSIKFLSNQSNFLEDINVIMKMPKIMFLKSILKK